MPVDPSIIANSMSTMASNMPDVNALMQQQMTGMQNINILERQRRADALELEDRALAAEERAAKKQEAATIKALLPAFTYGIQTGDIVGAGSLVPPEMRGQLQPFIDALTGQSPEQVRAALIGSLASSPEGEAALGAIQRAQTAEIQLGQLDVSRERLAFDTEQAAAEKAGGGKVSFRETDAEGNVRMYDARGNEIGILPKAGKPAPAPAIAPDQKMQAKEGVDGTLSRILAQYDILAKEKGIVSAKNTAAQNIGARLSTQFGPTVGRSVGTKSQTARDTIANLRQALLADIKAATGMSSKAIDSNVELKSFLDSLGDPDQSIETIKNTLAELSIKYGAGSLGDIAEDTTAAPAPAQLTAPPASAIEFLINNPQFSDQFDAKYGAGAAARILGE